MFRLLSLSLFEIHEQKVSRVGFSVEIHDQKASRNNTESTLSDIVNPAFAAFVQYYEWTFQLKYMNKKCQGIVQKVLLSNIVDPAFAAFVKYYDERFSV